MKHQLMGLIVGIGIMPFVACAQEYAAPRIRLPLMHKAPLIDGVINESEWFAAGRMERFGHGKTLSSQQATFWVGADTQHLYIAVSSETPPDGKVLSRVNPLPDNTDAHVFVDDCIEIILDPLRSDDTGRRRTYQVVLNPKGAIWDQKFNPRGGGEAWRGNWKIANSVKNDRWQIEVALPWSDVDVTPADLQHPMGIRVVRDWQQSTGPKQTEWSNQGGAFRSTGSSMPVVTWDSAAPVVQVLQLQNQPGGALDAKVAVHNPHQTPLKVQAAIKTRPQNSPERTVNEILEIPAGETQFVEQAATAEGISLDEILRTSISVTSVDGNILYYSRDFSWQLERPKNVWNVNPDAVRQINTSFAYFPYHDALKVHVNLADFPRKDRVKDIQLELRNTQTRQLLAQTTMPSPKKDISEIEWDIPQLSEGTYTLTASYEGADVEPQQFEFVRHIFDWEHNTLGKKNPDAVISPFTPIAVKGNDVSTILRRHEMNGLGLWNQVYSLDKPLLKSPMRLEVTANGKTSIATGTLNFTEKKDARVVANAKWQAGVLSGSTQSTWDYDGVMKSTFTLNPTTQTIDSATLVIPLDDAQTPLMHAVTDGTLFNYAGEIPAGTGRVWDGNKAARRQLIGSYVSYIWLGGPQRGISVFGDNDRGWITSDTVPCQEIVRNADGTLELRIHLIAKSVTIENPRTIVMGFQATPTKPMPRDWRTWFIGARGGGSGDQKFPNYQQTFLGQSTQWGGLRAGGDTYPINQDFSLYDEFVRIRKTGKYDPEYLGKWLQKNGVVDEKKIAYYNRQLGYGLRSMSGDHDVIAYTNAGGLRLDTPEGQTFIDEWHRAAYPSRSYGYGAGASYDLVPVPSYRDYRAWYVEKMLSTFVDGIYYDVVYPKDNFDTIGTDAYELPDGRIQPSVGIWDMRELIKRTAQLSGELGKPNRTMLHMTNTALAPEMSFAAQILEWEDHNGDTPYQERFSRDYIQAINTGRQFGTVPFALSFATGPDPEKVAWAQRTGAGVMLTHEIKSFGSWKDYWKGMGILQEFGYGAPQAKVWNYWQDDYPATILGDETSSILLSKPGSVLIAVCDYGKGGDISIELNVQKLGLSGQLKATDAEDDRVLKMDDAGKVLFSLPQNDFKIIRFEQVQQ